MKIISVAAVALLASQSAARSVERVQANVEAHPTDTMSEYHSILYTRTASNNTDAAMYGHRAVAWRWHPCTTRHELRTSFCAQGHLSKLARTLLMW